MSDDSKFDMDFVDLDEFIPIPKQSRMEPAAMEKIYRGNLEKLSRHHPELVEIVESATIDGERIKIFDSESGNPRIVYKRNDGEEINIHSAGDPVECARQAIDLLGRIEKEGIVVLFGFGLGYFAEEIFRRFEKGHILLIYEATPEIFRMALSIKDFSGLIDSAQVKIVLGENADNFSVIHTHYHHIINGKFWIVKHNPSVKLNQTAYDNFLKRLKEEKMLADIGVSTVVSRGKEFIDAFFSNVQSIMRKPGVNALKNIFKGCKAIIVSAGPSLDRNVHLLKKAKGKAVIIATGGALPTLLACDIIPDLVVEIDPASENIEDKFQQIPILKEVPFICLIQYTPELIKIYPGPLFMNSVMGNIAFVW
ncbi:MAG: motility associated factor glycosyltransferase family protein, partial [Deferribacteres bacterium]|nr:motility associated factor glycosyltransferase family protein [Deferribacteres bacterium]